MRWFGCGWSAGNAKPKPTRQSDRQAASTEAAFFVRFLVNDTAGEESSVTTHSSQPDTARKDREITFTPIGPWADPPPNPDKAPFNALMDADNG